MVATPRRAAGNERGVFRYVPPDQVVARAVTYIGDVLLEFSLRFSGSLTVTCAPAETGDANPDRATLRIAGVALHRLADGLFISAVRADRPTIESSGGHRFTHTATSVAGPRTRRFAGECVVEIPAGAGADDVAITGSLQYALDVRGGAASDPPLRADDLWLDRHETSLASIGAIVLEPVPVAADHAARLFAS